MGCRTGGWRTRGVPIGALTASSKLNWEWTRWSVRGTAWSQDGHALAQVLANLVVNSTKTYALVRIAQGWSGVSCENCDILCPSGYKADASCEGCMPNGAGGAGGSSATVV